MFIRLRTIFFLLLILCVAMLTVAPRPVVSGTQPSILAQCQAMDIELVAQCTAHSEVIDTSSHDRSAEQPDGPYAAIDCNDSLNMASCGAHRLRDLTASFPSPSLERPKRPPRALV